MKVATIRTTSFPAASKDGGSGAAQNLAGALSVACSLPGGAHASSQFVKQELVKSERPDLASASRVVCGGMPCTPR